MHSFSFCSRGCQGFPSPASVYSGYGVLFFDRADNAPVIVEIPSLRKAYPAKQQCVTVIDRFPRLWD